MALGPYQQELFVDTEEPLSVNATVCNVDSSRTHLDFGKAHFALKIYLSTGADFSSSECHKVPDLEDYMISSDRTCSAKFIS